MIKIIIVFLTTSIIGFWGAMVYFNGPQIIFNQVSIENSKTPLTPQTSPSPFILKAPSAGLVGRIIDIEGDVQIGKRELSEPIEATVGADLVDGETVYTEEGSALVDFMGVFSVGLDTNAQITIINALQKTFLLTQISGLVAYNAIQPISVRTAGTVIQVKGEVSVTPKEEEGLIEIRTQEGTAVLSWIDNDNETRVEEIPENTFAIFDGATDEINIE